MPTYEYVCRKCGHQFEAFQTMSAAPLVGCPQCDGEVKRIISGGSGMIFKGSGFYITDYKKEKKSAEAAEKPASKPDEKPKEKPKEKTEDKPKKDSDKSAA